MLLSSRGGVVMMLKKKLLLLSIILYSAAITGNLYQLFLKYNSIAFLFLIPILIFIIVLKVGNIVFDIFNSVIFIVLFALLLIVFTFVKYFIIKIHPCIVIPLLVYSEFFYLYTLFLYLKLIKGNK